MALDRVAPVHARIGGAVGGEEMEFNRASALVAAAEIMFEFIVPGCVWLCCTDKAFKASLALPRAGRLSREAMGWPNNPP